MVVIGNQLLERSAQTVAHCVHMLQEARLQHHVEHCLPRRHRQRIAAIGRAVRADDHALGRFLGRKAGTERESAADALGRRQDIGRDAIMLIGPHFAGAAVAALDFVKNQQQAMLVAAPYADPE